MALRTDLRVLVVDDMSVSRQILGQMLDRLGIRRVSVCATAESALRSMAEQPVDLVIADLNMPGINGIELLRTMRCHYRTQNTRFILTSGDDTSPDFAEGRRLGMLAVLIKPFKLDTLLDCVELATGRI